MPLKRNTTRGSTGRNHQANGRRQRGNGRDAYRYNSRDRSSQQYDDDTLRGNGQLSDNDNGYGNGSDNGDVATKTIRGVLDTSRDGHGVLRVHYSDSEEDAYISTSQIRRFRLRPGDMIEGPGREPKENERYWGLLKVDTVNGEPVDKVAAQQRIKFHSLTPVYPDELIKLEISEEPLSLRIIDMIAPIGKGQRSLIVSPPKAGKTTLLKDIATGVANNHPEIHIMAVLVGERPEEVTDIRRHIDSLTKSKGETAASNFDEPATDQCRVAELALERAKRLVESGQDVVVLLDSITRLARAYNLAIPTSGRTLSGGFDPQALFPPKRFFGAARNFEVLGSLTIVGTALVDTGSRMDEVIYEEFKGTGNQEVHLDRRLAERRVHPAIDVQRSGTRRDDLLIEPMAYQSIITLHRMLDMLDREKRTESMIERLKRTKSNKEFLASLKDG
ncbi:MAG: transcription termination factor Rho [Candidatus Pacebacteria bacterium CG10_big_fil_rev_8_21_14_0_10_56_10]|nr:MAG: transcription termination factor Rho [Candidatus Pacebacteria bacterium CG10_big_fil_rev_8_21_14_0_10_56_10]